MKSEKQLPTILSAEDGLIFTNIFKTFRIAIRPGNLIIALLAVAVICLAGWLMDFSDSVIAAAQPGGSNELNVYINNPAKLSSYIEQNKDTDKKTGVFSTIWHFAETKFQKIVYSVFAFDLPSVVKNIAEYFKAALWAVKYHFIYTLIFSLFQLAVIAVAGGAICRMTALQFAQGEKPPLSEGLRYSFKKFLSLLTAPIAPLTIIIFISLFILLLGLLGNIPWVGELLIGIFLIPALLAGALITILLIGTVASLPLMYPTITYDNSDCFDAISRAFSYIYSRPWRMGFYTAVAAVYGSICYIFVRFFIFLILASVHWALELAIFVNLPGRNENISKLTNIWPEPSFTNLFGNPPWLHHLSTGFSESVAAFLIHLTLLACLGLLVAFIISFYFTANTIIYALLRKKVDNTDFDQIQHLTA